MFMTEAEWLRCIDPQKMLAFLRDGGELSERKARLFVVACCRHLWHLLTEQGRDAVDVAEQDADGLTVKEDLTEAVSGLANPHVSYYTHLYLGEAVQVAVSGEPGARAGWAAWS